MDPSGRYAPSPTSDLHAGNLRTALLAWLFARSTGRRFRLRVEDLDVARVAAAPDVARRQLSDLAALGLDHDGGVLWQSARLDRYAAAIARLDTYPCFCTRRDIAEAARAPHDGHRAYPGTCRDLSAAQRAARARERPAALRVRVPADTSETIIDELHGAYAGPVDDFVVRRTDGVYAYHLAAVVDDLECGVDQVVRGDDLLPSAPRQAWLTRQLGGQAPRYAHVPLAVNTAGKRLAKRDGAVTRADLGLSDAELLSLLAVSLGLADERECVTSADLVPRFDPHRIPRTPWVVTSP